MRDRYACNRIKQFPVDSYRQRKSKLIALTATELRMCRFAVITRARWRGRQPGGWLWMRYGSLRWQLFLGLLLLRLLGLACQLDFRPDGFLMLFSAPQSDF